ncbi:hypothetical protein [Sphingomonas elodea]|uniref:hypothetical protein n=1 Tax=Sphingomonas elodea TaxID=179878 RepID=UPI0002631A48|nr:hypothetical protein [Sphingomonas elodea]
MQSPTMDAPAELRQRISAAEGDAAGEVQVIARGSLVLLAHALAAVEPPERRACCWIETAGAILDSDGAAALLRHWETGVPFEDRV